MNTTVTQTKILLPRRRPDLLSRERLLELLDDLLDYRLTLVAAPAGYGKTSLLVDLAHQVDYPVCWFALDPLDQDLQRFLAYFIASIQQHFPEFGKNSQSVLQGVSQANLDIGRLLTTIVNDAYENISEHFVVVLDDYHLVDDSEGVNYFVSRFGQEMDENVHLVIASRTLLSLPDLPLLVGRSQVKGLSFEELAFRPQEIKTLLHQNYHQTISDAKAQELASETEGWITGLLLSAETMWQGMEDRLRVTRVSGVDLYDYLAQQVLDQQSAPVREFLLHTSLLEEFNEKFCEAVLGEAPVGESWAGLMAALMYHNLFVQPVGERGMWLRYHHLFRDFLQAQLVKHEPEEEKRILRRLVDVYAERGEWERAYAVCQRLGEQEVSTRFIKRVGFDLGKAGRLSTLASWIDNLPANVLPDDPELLSLRGGAAVMLGEVEKGVSLLDKAIRLFRDTENIIGLARSLVWRATAHRFLGKYQDSLTDSEAALGMTIGEQGFLISQAEALRAKGMALHSLGQAIEATFPLEQSIKAYDLLNDEKNAAVVHMDLGLVDMQIGRYRSALEHYEQSLGLWRKISNSTQQANLYNNLGVLTHLKGDLLQAKTFLFEALECAVNSGYERIEAFVLSSLGDILSDLDMYDEAREWYQQAKQIARQTEEQYLVIYIDLVETNLLRKKGEFTNARQNLIRIERFIKEGGSSYERGFWELENGRISLAKGKYDEAACAFREALEDFQSGGQQIEMARAGLYLAYTQSTLGEKDSARLHLTEAFQNVVALESFYPLVSAGRELKEFLEEAQGFPQVEKPAFRLLAEVIRFEEELPRLRRQISPPEVQEVAVPPDLDIQAFGRGWVKVKGEPIVKPEWVNQKTVRELFFFLLTRPKGLTKESLGRVLWPESSPEQLKTQFKNAMYRLRKALGKGVVVYDAEGKRYHFNWDLDYRYDVEEFRAKFVQALKTNDPEDRLNAFQESVEFYAHPYLLGMDGLWVEPIRVRLFRDYKKGVLTMAEMYLDSGEAEKAIQICHRLLSVDASQEVAYRLVMRAHAAKGDRAGVARQYQRCRQALARELDASPSPVTKELYERLMS